MSCSSQYSSYCFVGFPAEIVFFIRASDKLNRIKSLAKKEASVKEEKIYDTVIDLANYSAMFARWLKENEVSKK